VQRSGTLGEKGGWRGEEAIQKKALPVVTAPHLLGWHPPVLIKGSSGVLPILLSFLLRVQLVQVHDVTRGHAGCPRGQEGGWARSFSGSRSLRRWWRRDVVVVVVVGGGSGKAPGCEAGVVGGIQQQAPPESCVNGAGGSLRQVIRPRISDGVRLRKRRGEGGGVQR